MATVMFLLMTSLVAVVMCDVTVPVGTHWAGGFQAKVCFSITSEMSSWKIHLKFDQPIPSMEAFTAEIDSVSADKTEYVLSNKVWNGAEHVGDQLCTEFQGHPTGDVEPVITATLEGATDGGSFSVTARPTVAPVVTQSLAPGETRPPTTPLSMPDGNGPTSVMMVKNDWAERGGFEGWLDFDITEPTLGFVMKIKFSKPVSAINRPAHTKVVSHNADGTEWMLTNTDDLLYMKPGDHIQIRFTADLAGNDHTGAPSATAVIIGLGNDPWSVPDQKSTCSAKYNYDDVMMKSIMFYEAQRSGKLPADNRIPWRGDSALGDQGDNGEDLTGGWYDAGDFVKFNFPMAWATVMLEWGFLSFKDAYASAGQTQHMCDSVKWPLDYLLKCYIPGDKADPDDDVLYAQVGDGGADHGSWGRPEEMTMARPAYKLTASKPGSDLAMEQAAAFAAGYLVFKDICNDKAYADTLLENAKMLWEFAIAHQGKYSASVTAAAGYYQSFNVTDENCWGSLWLYKATGEDKYLTEAKKWYDMAPDWGMSWDDVIIGNQVLMYNLTGDSQYIANIEGTFNDWMPGGSVPYTPKGLAYRLQWGSLRYASNMAAAALLAAESGVHPDEYRKWAQCQIHYALGDGGRSFVVGFGKNPPVSPHHRSSSCPMKPAICNMNILHLPTANVHTLYGALVGGPGKSDDYTDSRENYINNEVANDYNAGFQTAVAGLLHLCLIGETPSGTCP